MPFITVDAEDIYYTASPISAAGPHLLAIHGSGGTHRHWPENFRAARSARVYALDLPGHGRSGGPGCDRVEAYAVVVQRMIARLNLSAVVLAGHSLGGAIVQALAIQRPAWLSGIILVGTGARLRVHPDILNGLASDYPATVDLICNWAFGPETPLELIQAARRDFLETPPTVLHADYSACNQFDAMDRIGAIQIPTLIISGSADRLTPAKYGDFLQNQIPGSRHVRIEGAGHMMALEKPEEFIAHVNSFINAKLQS